MGCVIRQKSCRKNAYFSTKFGNFYIGHIESRFFSEPLRGHVEHEDVHITFYIEMHLKKGA
jgi:hypothetical protein